VFDRLFYRVTLLLGLCFWMLNVSAAEILSPVQFKNLFQKAQNAYEAKAYDKAEKIWSRLLKVDPTNLSVQNNLAVLEMKQKNYDAAKKRLVKALYQNKELSYLFDNLNQIYAYEAQQAYQQVFKKTNIEPPHPKVMALVNTTSLWQEKKKQLAREYAALQKQKAEQALALAKKKHEKLMAQYQIEVLKALKAWQYAWHKQRVWSYLHAYVDNFKPQNGETHQQWVAHRTKSLTRPRFIKISLKHIKVKTINDEEMRVTFTQTYRSNLYHDQVKKVLVFKLIQHNPSQWRIVKEDVVH